MPGASCGDQASKKRKVSFTKKSDEPEKEATVSEQQPDIKDEAPVHGGTGQYCGLMRGFIYSALNCPLILESSELLLLFFLT